MEDNTKRMPPTAENIADVVHRVSCLCHMLSYLSDSTSEIPTDSLCDSMGLLRDVLEDQAVALYTLQLNTKKVVGA